MKPLHLWVRAEQRAHEARVGITPEGTAALRAEGVTITVEDSHQRCIPIAQYQAAGCTIAPEGSWPSAPDDAIILGLKDLPDDGTPLRHTHIMFGHAYKGQPSGQTLLSRFAAGGGQLLDLEYLTDTDGRRVAAFGYWAGYAGAAVSLLGWAAQKDERTLAPIKSYATAADVAAAVSAQLSGRAPSVLIIGALGRVGSGAADLCAALHLPVTKWDMDETAHGGPFPEIYDHDIFLSCILAQDGTPVFVPETAKTATRKLRMIGDIACDPNSAFSPIKVYDQVTTWTDPFLRVHDTPPLDVMAIDNLPSLLPRESSVDFAAQLLPRLRCLDDQSTGVWRRARDCFDRAMVW